MAQIGDQHVPDGFVTGNMAQIGDQHVPDGFGFGLIILSLWLQLNMLCFMFTVPPIYKLNHDVYGC